ncbi:hypothetical protein [Chamaesiphon sp.]|uniref:hypothetical protein n=1 Tax=Chamaesiphon sp. TaxID=2814140 RepID=UPI003594346D
MAIRNWSYSHLALECTYYILIQTLSYSSSSPKLLTPSAGTGWHDGQHFQLTQTLKQFTDTETVAPAATTLAESIAGKTYTRTERIQLEMETLARHFQHRRQLLDTVLSASQVAQLLGTSRQTPHDRVSSQTLTQY